MLLDELLNIAKTKKVNVYFDMDGVLVEYLLDRENKRNVTGTNFYADNRPINYIINVAKKLSEIDNIEVGIISNCPLAEQIEQKVNWLKKYAPFIKSENIHIICYENMDFKKEDKPKLKAFLLEKIMKEGNYCVLIEDDLKNIKNVNEYFNADVAFHVSNVIE